MTVADQAGTVLATGQLDDGTIGEVECTYHFTVTGVPDAKVYEVTVSHRGALDYSMAKMKAADWHVELSLGS